MYYYLYQIENKINGKIYVGVHKTSNLDDGYMGSGKYLQNAINKYGVENFEKKILKWFDNQEEMYQEEAEIVNEEWISRKDTYNIRAGGNGGWDYAVGVLEKKYGEEWTKIVCGKAREALKEKYGEEWGKFLNKRSQELYPEGTWKGRKHNEESKKKIGKANAEHQKGSGNSQYGTMWITNGEDNKKIKKDESIPEGWYKGRTINKK